MKRLIVGSLTVLLLAVATAPVVNAQETALNSTTLNSNARNQIAPFNLVSLAYQGNFKTQGIPGSGSLVAAYQIGRVSAEDLVKSAVAANILSPSVLKNRGYLNAVDTQLSNLGKDR